MFVMRKITQCLVSHFIEFIKLYLNIFKKGSLLKKMLIFVLNLKIFLLVEKFSEVENNKFFCMFPTKISFFSLFFYSKWPTVTSREKQSNIFCFSFSGNMSKIFPLNWRFVSALDPQVDLMLVRDLDSEISPREFSAFDEFAQSAQKFHIMRYVCMYFLS